MIELMRKIASLVLGLAVIVSAGFLMVIWHIVWWQFLVVLVTFISGFIFLAAATPD
jgi:hypothetical protein